MEVRGRLGMFLEKSMIEFSGRGWRRLEETRLVESRVIVRGIALKR